MLLPVPEGVTVHQLALLAVFQAEFDIRLKLVFPEGAVTFWFAGVTDKVGIMPDCVTVTLTGVRPITVTVTVAIRDVVRVLLV